MTSPTSLILRTAVAADLAALNAVVAAAVAAWDLPARVKRLSLPGYLYQPEDLGHLHLVVALDGQEIVGTAAWEPAPAGAVPGADPAMLLHGLYVTPGRQRCGIGSRLLGAALAAAEEKGFSALLVRAQRDAQPFFRARGFRPLPVADPERDYPYRLWRPVPAGKGAHRAR